MPLEDVPTPENHVSIGVTAIPLIVSLSRSALFVQTEIVPKETVEEIHRVGRSV